MKNWVVVANAAKARVLEETDKPGVYLHRADLVHPASRRKGIDRDADRPGRLPGSGQGLGHASFQPRTSPDELERERFAREVAAALEDGVTAGHCAGITLVASDPFLGHLKAQLGSNVAKRLLRTVPSDYTSLSERELAERLAAPLRAVKAGATGEA